MTGAKRVLALGGGGVSLKEAELGEAGLGNHFNRWTKMNGKFRVGFRMFRDNFHGKSGL